MLQKNLGGSETAEAFIHLEVFFHQHVQLLYILQALHQAIVGLALNKLHSLKI